MDNAGKSSMIVALKKIYNYENDLDELQPTIRVDYYRRQFMGQKLNFFDMGGQAKFRTSYLKNPHYFDDTDIFLYLIDIQDETRFEESMNYLEMVLNQYLDFSSPSSSHSIPQFYIVFSKSDPEYIRFRKTEYEDRKAMIHNLIVSKFTRIKFTYLETSIMEIFSISFAVSFPLLQLLNIMDMENLIKKLNIPIAVDSTGVFEESGMLLGYYSARTFSPLDEGYITSASPLSRIVEGFSYHLSFFKQLKEDNIDVFISDLLQEEGHYLCYRVDNPFHEGFDKYPPTLYFAIISDSTESLKKNTDKWQMLKKNLPQILFSSLK